MDDNSAITTSMRLDTLSPDHYDGLTCALQGLGLAQRGHAVPESDLPRADDVHVPRQVIDSLLRSR